MTNHAPLHIHAAGDADFDAIWPIFHAVCRAGDTYAYPTDTDEAVARRLWMRLPRRTFVAELGGQVGATYCIKTNHAGPGSHVCNCGYMVASSARGRGIARQLYEHSQQVAVELVYRTMQFNFVASTNAGAVQLWQKPGFDIVGRLPGTFRHPTEGFVDAPVMCKLRATDDNE